MTQRIYHFLALPMAAILMSLIIGALVWWLSGPSSDETVVYPASCTNGLHVLPPGMVLDVSTTEAWERSYSEYRRSREGCLIRTWSRTVYKLNRNLGEAYTAHGFDITRLVDCAFFSRTEWKCYYMDGSGPVVILDGLKAIHRSDLEDASPFFYLRRWQWWLARLYAWVGHPQGSWLIPEQVEYIGPKI